MINLFVYNEKVWTRNESKKQEHKKTMKEEKKNRDQASPGTCSVICICSCLYIKQTGKKKFKKIVLIKGKEINVILSNFPMLSFTNKCSSFYLILGKFLLSFTTFPPPSLPSCCRCNPPSTPFNYYLITIWFIFTWCVTVEGVILAAQKI